MGSLDASCLKGYSMLLGALLILVSVSGIGFGVFLLFGEPLAQQTYHTYRPNFEDIGPLMVVSIVSLLANIGLIGGAKQLSKRIVLTWLVWHYLLVLLFWAWYGYNMLKYHGYIDWSEHGMRQCYWCHQKKVQETLGYIGAIASFVLLVFMIPVHLLHTKLKKWNRHLTDYQYELEEPQYDYNQYADQNTQHQYNYNYNQSHYNHNQNQYQQQYQPQYQYKY